MSWLSAVLEAAAERRVFVARLLFKVLPVGPPISAFLALAVEVGVLTASRRYAKAVVVCPMVSWGCCEADADAVLVRPPCAGLSLEMSPFG